MKINKTTKTLEIDRKMLDVILEEVVYEDKYSTSERLSDLFLAGINRHLKDYDNKEKTFSRICIKDIWGGKKIDDEMIKTITSYLKIDESEIADWALMYINHLEEEIYKLKKRD